MNKKLLIAGCCALLTSIGANAQMSVKEAITELHGLGYRGIRALSFEDSPEHDAYTVIFKSVEMPDEPDKDAQMFFAKVVPIQQGAVVIFRAYQPCVVARAGMPMAEEIIMVNGQKINALSKCSIANGETVTSTTYGMKTQAGNDFVIKQFATNENVIVHFKNMPIPFKTSGFLSLMAKHGGKAL